jgi:hypothetical protein
MIHATVPFKMPKNSIASQSLGYKYSFCFVLQK